MFTFLGVLILIAGIIGLIIQSQTVRENVVEKEEIRDSSTGRIFDKETIVKKKSPDWMLLFNKKISLLLLIIGVVSVLTPKLLFFADRGYNYLLVHPGGKLDAVMVQGIKWRGFAKIDPWQKYIDVKVIGKDVEYDEDELEGVMRPVSLRFIDQVTAVGYVSTRFELPKVKEDFISLAVEFRSMSNLVNNTIIPTVKEQLVQTAYMFAAQNYISGEAQSFRQTFEEQLKSGTYAVDKKEHRDTIYSGIKVKGDRNIKEIKTRYEVIKIEKNGIPVRIPHELSENNIIVSQVIVDQIKLEPTFKERLTKQRDESAKRQLEQQKVDTAKSTQQRIIAEGERDKAAERVNQEKEQVKKLIAIETRLKEEKTNKELAQIELETQRLASQTVKVKADADAYEIKKKVSAGITPEVKLQMELNRDVAVAEHLSKTKWPEVLVTGNEGKQGNSLLYDMLGADYAKKMSKTKD